MPDAGEPGRGGEGRRCNSGARGAHNPAPRPSCPVARFPGLEPRHWPAAARTPGQQLPVEGGTHVARPTHPLPPPPESARGVARPKEGRRRRRGPGPLLTSEPLSPCPGCPWPRPALPRPPHLARRDGLGGARRIATAAAACRAPPPPAAHTPLSQPASPPEAHPQAQSFCERALSPSRARALSRPHQPPDTR